MQTGNVSFSILEQHDPNYRVKQRLHQLLERGDGFGIKDFHSCTTPQCVRNIQQLSDLKKEARAISKEHGSRFHRVTKLFQVCCIDIGGNQWSVEEESKHIRHRIDLMISNNIHSMDLRCQSILTDSKMTSDPEELMYAFMWGVQTQSRKLHYRSQLVEVYNKIVQCARHGHYTIDRLRAVALAAERVIPEFRLVTTIETDEANFVFHDLLLIHQFGKIRVEHPTRLPFKIHLNVHPLIIKSLHQLIEEGRSPSFKGFEARGAIKFLEACAWLKATPEIIQEGLFLLEEKSSQLHLKVYEAFVKVSCSGGAEKDLLKHISVINEVRPVFGLNLAYSHVAPTIEVLNGLATNFHQLRFLECAPYSTASKEDWERLFDLPCLKKVVFHLSDEDEEYLNGLFEAIETHPKPPKIYVKNGIGVRHELLSRFVKRNS